MKQILYAVALEFNKLTDTQKIILKHWIRNTVDETIAENAVEILDTNKVKLFRWNFTFQLNLVELIQERVAVSSQGSVTDASYEIKKYICNNNSKKNIRKERIK